MSISTIWKSHGTKIIGFATSAIGALALLDHETLDLIGQVFGTKGGPRVTRGILIISGLATAYRGYKNSQPKEPQ
jgi:uncharacterized membrane protein YuzA (DUF378 family)